MKKLIKVSCGAVKFEFEIIGNDIVDFQDNQISDDVYYHLLKSSEDLIDAVFIIEDQKDISYRVLFFRLKPNPGMELKQFESGSKELLGKLFEIHKKHDFVADFLSEFANLCFQKHCTLYSSAILLRSGEKIEPLSDEDRKAAGLAGIPIDLLDESDEQGETEYLARIYSGGMPPLLLIQSQGIIFPTRAWFPAGLMPDWKPWKQNVEFQTSDRLVVHTEFRGSKAELKEFHETIKTGETSIDTDEMSMVVVRAGL